MEQRLIDANSLNKRHVTNVGDVYLAASIALAATIDPVHAAGGCYCRECRHHDRNSCPAYDLPMNRTSLRIEHCSYGEPRTPPAE